MPDLTAVYTLTTPGGNISFNNGDIGGTTDLYWIQTIQGLGSAPIRAPIDNAPQADGGLVHNFWQTARHVGIQGFIIIQSAIPGSSACNTAFCNMEDDLQEALDSILRADGTLSWTPANGGAKSLTVRNDVPFDPQPDADYHVRTFTFGLVAADPAIA